MLHIQDLKSENNTQRIMLVSDPTVYSYSLFINLEFNISQDISVLSMRENVRFLGVED